MSRCVLLSVGFLAMVSMATSASSASLSEPLYLVKMSPALPEEGMTAIRDEIVGTDEDENVLVALSPFTFDKILEFTAVDLPGQYDNEATTESTLKGRLDAVAAAMNGEGLTMEIVEQAQPLRQKLRGDNNLPSGYHSPDEIDDILRETEKSFPDIAKVVNLSHEYGPGPTFEGRSILAIKLSKDVHVDEAEPNIFVVACHHAREIVTPEMALDIVDRLTKGYGSDDQLTSILDNNEVWVAPVWNPDGLHYVWEHNNMWRKNRNTDQHFEGIDQNRNYDLGWDGPCPGDTHPSSEVFRGPAAMSEVETQTMANFTISRNLAKVLDYHSYGREVLTGYRCIDMDEKIKNYILAEGTALADAIGYGTRLPSADGEHQEWTIRTTTNYAFLQEVSDQFQPSFQAAKDEIERVWPATLKFLTKEVPVHGTVTLEDGSVAANAEITIDEVSWSAGESRHTDNKGRYHLFLPAGSYTVNFKSGDASTSVAVKVVDGESSQVDVHMGHVVQTAMY